MHYKQNTFKPKRSDSGVVLTIDRSLHQALKQAQAADTLRDMGNEALKCYLMLPPEARRALGEAYDSKKSPAQEKPSLC